MSEQKNAMNWASLSKNISKVLGDDFWDELNQVTPKQGPAIDVYETPSEVIAVIEIPGIESTRDIHIQLHGFTMEISGRFHLDYPVSQDNLLQSERSFGDFQRKIDLPHNIFPGKGMYAYAKNGLVIVHIPKASDRQSMEIPINFTK